MRRLIVSALVIAAAGGFALLAGGAASSSGGSHDYVVQLDNAFGLVTGADLKVGGVRAGKITTFNLEKGTNHALVGISVTGKGFDSFRTDASCEARPQSLIGEYFLDCQPGTAAGKLPNGGKIPIAHTTSTIPGDLVNNVLRRPYRERLRIILGELGAGVGGRAQDLNEALRRFNPALRETDRVLAILARENQTIKNLTQNADTVITALADNRSQVGRFVVTANRTSTASAQRQAAIAGTWHNFPGFLEQLRPSMVQLGRAADSQIPALRDLRAAAPQLNRFFIDLVPFAHASQIGFRTLADAARAGRPAIAQATPTVDLLNTFATGAPELAKNLSIVLQHLDDPQYAVETDPRAAPQHPVDKRANYTGLEALLQYVYDQSTAINIFDREHYILKVDLFRNQCAPYADAATVKGNAALLKACDANITGPHQPGLNEPDPTSTGLSHSQKISSTQAPQAPQGAPTLAPSGAAPTRPGGSGGSGGGSSGGGGPTGPTPPVDLGKTLQGVEGIIQGALPNIKLPNTGDLPNQLGQGVKGLGVGGGSNSKSARRSSGDQRRVLDYLLGP